MQPPKTKVSVSEEREGMGREVNETRKMKSDRNDELELLLLLPMFELWSSFSLDRDIERVLGGYVYNYTQLARNFEVGLKSVSVCVCFFSFFFSRTLGGEGNSMALLLCYVISTLCRT